MGSALNTNDAGARCIFNVMIIYDELAAGKRAMQLFSNLAHEHCYEIGFRPLIWRLDLVADLGWRPFLDEESFSTDLFIISMTGQDDIPLPVRIWLRSCLSGKVGSGAAVVALLGKDGELDTTASPRFEFLQGLAAETSMEFFAPISCNDSLSDRTVRIAPSWSEEHTYALHEISARQQGADTRLQPPFNSARPNWHWGINE